MEVIGFALCLENTESEDWELNKVYPVVEPESNDPDTYLRVIDESEQDYLYPRSMFEIVNLPVQIHQRVIENIAAYRHACFRFQWSTLGPCGPPGPDQLWTA